MGRPPLLCLAAAPTALASANWVPTARAGPTIHTQTPMHAGHRATYAHAKPRCARAGGVGRALAAPGKAQSVAADLPARAGVRIAPGCPFGDGPELPLCLEHTVQRQLGPPHADLVATTGAFCTGPLALQDRCQAVHCGQARQVAQRNRLRALSAGGPEPKLVFRPGASVVFVSAAAASIKPRVYSEFG